MKSEDDRIRFKPQQSNTIEYGVKMFYAYHEVFEYKGEIYDPRDSGKLISINEYKHFLAALIEKDKKKRNL